MKHNKPFTAKEWKFLMIFAMIIVLFAVTLVIAFFLKQPVYLLFALLLLLILALVIAILVILSIQYVRNFQPAAPASQRTTREEKEQTYE